MGWPFHDPSLFDGYRAHDELRIKPPLGKPRPAELGANHRRTRLSIGRRRDLRLNADAAAR